MIAVIFEVTPKAEGKEQYFDIALGLKEHLLRRRKHPCRYKESLSLQDI